MHSFRMFSTMMVSSQMVVVMLQALMLQTSSAQIDVSVHPAQIDIGLSPFLDVNCTFSINTNSAMAEVISLTVSRENNTELATVTTVSNHQVNVTSSEGITADGVINTGGQSYIHLHWDYPTDTQNGTYICIARGIDINGHIIETVNTSAVNVNQPELENLVEELKQMTQKIHHMKMKMEYQLDLSSVFLLPPLKFNNTRYFVSKAPFQDFNESIIICKAYGGMLAEMDDQDEYHTVQNYVQNITSISYVYIGGTDEGHDGRWVLPSSKKDIPVTDWADSEPSSGEKYNNCLCLFRGFEWKMDSCPCHHDTGHTYERYIFQINNKKMTTRG